MRKGQKKAATPGLIRKPSGIFWVVIHIPKEARKALGKTKLHFSTETRDRTRAIEIWGASTQSGGKKFATLLPANSGVCRTQI
jgi:hypothetical protein